MPLYEIRNRRTGETLRTTANSAQEACEVCGWQIGYCYTRLLSVGDRVEKGHDREHAVARGTVKTS